MAAADYIKENTNPDSLNASLLEPPVQQQSAIVAAILLREVVRYFWFISGHFIAFVTAVILSSAL